MSDRRPFTNTTIGVVLTTARLSKVDCHLLAQSGTPGYSRAIHPAPSRSAGAAVVARAPGAAAVPPVRTEQRTFTGEADLDLIRAVATETVEEAIRGAVRP